MEKYTELIEAYCLGLLPEKEAAEITLAATQNPALRQQIEETERTLMNYSNAIAKPALKDAVLSSLAATPYVTKIDTSNPPLINRNSDVAEWNEAIAGIEPSADHGNIKTSFLTFTDELQLCVAWLYNSLEEDEHHEDEFEESFLILEGSCECNIGGKMLQLKAGDYLEIPFNTKHTIVATSPEGYVKAIIQRKRLAA